MFELFGWYSEFMTVHPHEICAFEFCDGKIGQVVFAEIDHVVVVAFEIGDKLRQPFFTLIVGGDCGDYSERIDIAYLVDVDCLVDFSTHDVIGGYDICNL